METEAKFVVPDDAAFARLLAAEQFGAYHRAKGRVAHVRDRYVDTPDRRFYHAGYAARVRSGDGGLLLTLKQLAGTVRNGVHAREEYEVTVPGLEIGGWPACEARDLAEKIADDRPLVDLVALEQTRNKAILQQDDRAVAEWSLDDVTIPTGSAPARFYELEVELLPDGNAADLATLATVFAVDYGLAPQPESKFERALHAVAPAKQVAGTAPLRHLPEASGHARPERVTTSLANGKPGRAEAGAAPEPADAPITPTDSMATAARKVLAAQYATMQACEETAREGADPEGVHDMRVAVRRMRAALRVADPYLGGKAVKRVRQDLREIAHALGAVRDLDVLIKNAENFRDDLPDDRQTDLAPLLDAWKGARKRARKQLIRLLDSADYARFRKHMAAFLAEEDAPPAAEAASKEAAQAEVAPYQVRHVLASALWERYEAVRAYETVMADAAVPQLHALRITGKYLRYTLEFFRHVLPAEAGALIDDVVTLQDALGELHDADVAAGLIREHIAAAYPRRKKAPAEPPPGLAAYQADREAALRRICAEFPATTWPRLVGADWRACLAAVSAAV
jgi:CHAD domain-containing protein